MERGAGFNEAGTGRHERGSGADPGAMAGAHDAVVEALVASVLEDRRTRHLGDAAIPSRPAIMELVEALREVMFPGFFGRRGLTKAGLFEHTRELVGRVERLTREQVRAVLRYMRGLDADREGTVGEAEAIALERRAAEVASAFVGELAGLRRALALDVQAAYDGDPAAIHTDETILCYPGVDAIFAHRAAHALHRLGVPLLPRIIQEMAHGRTGIDIHPGAQIGASFFIDHGGGVVIGQTSVIGKHVRIYQGVTLGARSFKRDAQGRLVRGTRRHPTIGDRVAIFAGAVILGGDTVIGDDCVIGGGVVVSQSVPPGHIVRAKSPELVLRTNREAMGGFEEGAIAPG